jgi:thiamine-phosphate pyrophosphorylase
MHRRHPSSLPRLWLMTDERMGEALLPAIACLPKGSGLVFRHYDTAQHKREALLTDILVIARKRRIFVLIGGATHGRHRGAISAPVHSIPERIAAERNGAKLLFVSPAFPTQSHPGARALGRARFGMLIKGARTPIVALGGMTRRKAIGLSMMGIHGWAAIDAFRT